MKEMMERFTFRESDVRSFRLVDMVIFPVDNVFRHYNFITNFLSCPILPAQKQTDGLQIILKSASAYRRVPLSLSVSRVLFMADR
jgi:hypothetical protein